MALVVFDGAFAVGGEFTRAAGRFHGDGRSIAVSLLEHCPAARRLDGAGSQPEAEVVPGIVVGNTLDSWILDDQDSAGGSISCASLSAPPPVRRLR